MAAQRTRAELLVENLANAETTRTPEGGPYRRKDVVFQTDAAGSPFASVMSAAMGGDGRRGGLGDLWVDPARSRTTLVRLGIRTRVRTGYVAAIRESTSRRGNGGPDECLQRLSGERGLHVRGERNDSTLHRPVAIVPMSIAISSLVSQLHLSFAHVGRGAARRRANPLISHPY